MAAVRTFVAVTLDNSLHQIVGQIVKGLATSNAKVKWVEPENVHVTLKFLGNVEEERLPDVFAACERAAKGIHPIDIELRALGCFPDTKSPRVVWLGIDKGVDPVKQLQERVESELQAAGFAKEEKPFKAHLTLGRVKGKQGLSRLCRLLERGRNVFVGAMRVEKISVMKSTILPTGPLYTELKAIALQ